MNKTIICQQTELDQLQTFLRAFCIKKRDQSLISAKEILREFLGVNRSYGITKEDLDRNYRHIHREIKYFLRINKDKGAISLENPSRGKWKFLDKSKLIFSWVPLQPIRMKRSNTISELYYKRSVTNYTQN